MLSFFVTSLISLFMNANYSSNKILSMLKELFLVLLALYVLSPLFLGAMKEHASDTLHIPLFICFAGYLALYNYKKQLVVVDDNDVQNQPGMLKNTIKDSRFYDQFERDVMTEDWLPLILLCYATLHMCSRYENNIQVFCQESLVYT
jgi:hypothetical protein